MDFASRDGHPGMTSIRFSESEVWRLTQSEQDLEGRLVSARSALEESTAVRQVLLLDGETMLNERAIAAADARVKSAEGIVCKLEEALAAVGHERDRAQQRLETAHEHARRLDEAASIALVICEIVDALKAFERASDRIASALEGARGKATHTAPFIAASLRISKTSFATEARAVLSEVEAYRAGLLDGSVKPTAPLQPSSGVGEVMRVHTFVAAEPAPSIVPPPIPPALPEVAGAERRIG